MNASPILRAELSRRIRTGSLQEWALFTNLWMAFNAIYGGEPDARERARVMAAIRRGLSEGQARALLRERSIAIAKILAIPPGDMRLGRFDAGFRRKTRELTGKIRNGGSARAKSAALGGVLYQVRCNLLHGQKDPADERDRMLVRESARILERLVPALEESMRG